MELRNRRLWAILAVAAAGCSGGGGNGFSAPAVRPPVQAALPAALLKGASVASGGHALTRAATTVDYTTTCQTDNATDHCMELTGGARLQCVVKQRLFCPGPTEVLKLLDDVDATLRGVESRTSPGTACLAQAPVDHSADLAFPSHQPFPAWLQCKDASTGMAFGEKDGVWYLRRGGQAGGSVFSVDAAGEVNGYLWIDGQLRGSTALLQIKGSKAAGTVELTGGGVGVGFCALRYRSDASHLWIEIDGDGAGNSCDFDQSGATDSADYLDLCLDAATLGPVDGAGCASLRSGKVLRLMGRSGGTIDGGVAPTYAQAAPPPGGEPIDLVDPGALGSLSAGAADFAGLGDIDGAGPSDGGTPDGGH